MKVTPRIRGPKNYCDYADLGYGDVFTWHGDLYIKIRDTDVEEQLAVNLTSGDWSNNMCGESVLPVDAEIKWAKKTG